jgi:hypothetical protein
MQMSLSGFNVFHDDEHNCVVMQWRGYFTSPEFREGTEKMLDKLIESSSNKVLADVKEMTLIGIEDQHWLENNFIPRAVQYGFRALAILRPESYFNKVAIETVSYKVEQEKLRIAFFDNKDDAVRWLTEQDVPQHPL